MFGPNIRGAIQPRGLAGFGGQPANSGAFVPPQKEVTDCIAIQNDPVNMAGILYFDASRESSVYANNADLQVSSSLCLVAIRC